MNEYEDLNLQKLNLEELLAVVAKLTEKYTSKESSSVTYETAAMLMESVLYCINEYNSEFDSNKNELIPTSRSFSAEQMYAEGNKRVIEKVHKAKEIYERIIENFEDFRCCNYNDTILKGMPAFFLHYDIKFNPLDHILTLDYPIMSAQDMQGMCGVDLIFEYLGRIEMEKLFLDYFLREDVTYLLEKVNADYSHLYMDNICYAVLLNVIGCTVSGKSVLRLRLDRGDCNKISMYFEGQNSDQIEQKINNLINIIVNGMHNASLTNYFYKVSRDYAVRIYHAIQNDTLVNVFFVDE